MNIADASILFSVNYPDSDGDRLSEEHAAHGMPATPIKWIHANPVANGKFLFGVAPWLIEYLPTPLTSELTTATWDPAAFSDWQYFVQFRIPPRSRTAIARRLRTSYPGLTPAHALRLARYVRSRGVV